MNFGLRQRAIGEEQKRERLGRFEIVWIEPDDAREQRLRRRRPALSRAECERAAVLRRALAKLDDEPLGLGLITRRERGSGAPDFRRRRRLGSRRCPVEPAAARETQAAAARAGRSRGDLRGRRHNR
jgi:hypothetical protein